MCLVTECKPETKVSHCGTDVLQQYGMILGGIFVARYDRRIFAHYDIY
jgi:hypothetical protein